jgi:hypothetical protein
MSVISKHLMGNKAPTNHTNMRCLHKSIIVSYHVLTIQSSLGNVFNNKQTPSQNMHLTVNNRNQRLAQSLAQPLQAIQATQR